MKKKCVVKLSYYCDATLDYSYDYVVMDLNLNENIYMQIYDENDRSTFVGFSWQLLDDNLWNQGIA